MKSDTTVKWEKASHSKWKRGYKIKKRYEIQNIKYGGVGFVYICFDQKMNRWLAIKTLMPQFTSKHHFWAGANLIDEALSWIRLFKHPNIVQAKAFHFLEGKPCIFLEYIPGVEGIGSSLADWLRFRSLNLQEVLSFSAHIANGMQYVHQEGQLVHLDLKPNNILITADKIAKVTDFGLVGLMFSATDENALTSHASDENKSASLDSERKACGTPPYMAPEQWIDVSTVDFRSDIYSFGCVLYEMLTGYYPFHEGITREYFRHSHLEESPISTRNFNPDVSFELDNLVLKCLDKQPQRRFQSYSSILSELSKIHSRITGQNLELPNHILGESSIDEAIELAESAFNLLHPNVTIFILTKVLEKDPPNLKAWKILANAYFSIKDYKLSIQCISRAIQLVPTDTHLWTTKGVFLFFSEHDTFSGHDTEALSCFDRAIQLDQTNANAWQQRALVLEKIGNIKEAKRCREIAAQLDPSDMWHGKNSLKRWLERQRVGE